MNRQMLVQQWDHMRKVNGIALRLIASLPADKLDTRPIPNMRTPKELVAHMYEGVLKGISEGVARGQIQEPGDEKKTAAGIKSRDELLQFARNCWNITDQTVQKLGDAQLASQVKTPWGMDFPGHVCFEIVRDEFLHHRGQLYAYLRALGVEPPMMWDFEHNEAAFQPKAAVKA